MKCPHFSKCNQQIEKKDLGLCQGKFKEDWNQEDCFKNNDLGPFTLRKKPSEWEKEEEKET